MIKNIHILKKTYYFFLLSFATPLFSHAQSYRCGVDNGSGVVTLCNPIRGVNSIDLFLGKIIDIALFIATPVLVLAFLWAGFLFVTSGGVPEKIAKAKQTLLWTIVGAAIILGAKTAQLLISGTISSLSS
jgi:hypothetical protein